MNFPRTLLWINTALFVVFGIGFIFIPRDLSLFITSAFPARPSAMIDLRATYGGMALGVAIFFGYCAQQAHTRLGLLASWLVLGCIALARFVGIVLDGSPNVFMFALLAAEIIFVVLIGVALRTKE